MQWYNTRGFTVSKTNMKGLLESFDKKEAYVAQKELNISLSPAVMKIDFYVFVKSFVRATSLQIYSQENHRYAQGNSLTFG